MRYLFHCIATRKCVLFSFLTSTDALKLSKFQNTEKAGQVFVGENTFCYDTYVDDFQACGHRDLNMNGSQVGIYCCLARDCTPEYNNNNVLVLRAQTSPQSSPTDVLKAHTFPYELYAECQWLGLISSMKNS